MSTDNSTPTPLASTAMATPRTDHVFAAYEMGDASIWNCRDVSRQLEREVAAFQPLLAKVEGEADHLRKLMPQILSALGNGSACAPDASAEFMTWIPEEVKLTIYKKDRELTALRADLAAKEAALQAANDRWQKSSFREQQDIIDRLREQVAKADEDLLMDNQQLRESLSAKEANLQTANRIIQIVNAQAASRADKEGAR